MSEETYYVIIRAYSYEVNKVGYPIDRPWIRRAFSSIEDAMRDLNGAIDRQEGFVKGEGQGYFIEMPDGRLLSLWQAYKETFGVEPIRRENQSDQFPMLFPKGRKGKKQ